MWVAKKITADAANKMQVDSGLLLKKFDPAAPKEPQDADIICETTGDYHITCTPEVEDYFADVNNAPRNTKEGKRIKGWTCGLDVSCLSVTEETIKFSLGAAETAGKDGAISPRAQYIDADFQKIYWLGDMMDPKKLFVVEMENTISTGGFDFSARDDGKGNLALKLMAHTSLAAQDKIPMNFYILTKQEGGLPA